MSEPRDRTLERNACLDWEFTVRLMKHLVVPTFVIDKDGFVIIWNQACERLTALPASEVLGTNEHWRGFYGKPRPCLADLVLRSEGAVLKDLYVKHAHIISGETGLSAENWCAMPLAGSVRYLAIDAGPIYSAGGELLAVVETLRDITVQKDTEVAAETHRKQLDIALNNMAQGLAMFDHDSKLVIANPRYAKLYGIEPKLLKPGMAQTDILKHRVASGAYGDDAEEYCNEMLEITSRKTSTERVIELNDGRFIAVSYRAMADGGWVSTHDDITARREAEARIAHMAHHDELTGLPNRVLFRNRLVETLARTRRGEKFAVLCIDLDHFKAVNDTLGHPIGDALLRLVTERLRAELREIDTVARLGGDEFVLLQSSVNQPNDATALARRLVEVLGEPYEIEGHHVVVGASIGIASAPSDGADADTLLKNADLALYRAKADGRAAWRFFEPEMDARMQARRLLELDLRRALAAAEFELHYQPLVDLRTRRPTGFEALLRWRHPMRGLVSPADFIPIAEEIGLIGPIGEWVLRHACAEAASWTDGSAKVAVNLSACQFRTGRALHVIVAEALADAGLAPSRLELEITEGVMLHDTDETVATLHRLRAMGCSISMDDFGTGYSSLSYLRRFPFDKVKIDQSFVRDLAGDSGDCAAIVRAVVGLCGSLGMRTTAEGVETEEQLHRLGAEGCTEVQGYLFSRPVPAAEVPRLFEHPFAGGVARSLAPT